MTLVERNVRKVSDIQRNGLHVNQEVVNDISIIHDIDFNPQDHDIIYLCTKCYDNQSALASVTSQPTIIPVQNGYCQIPFGILWEGIASFVARTASRIEARFGSRDPGSCILAGRHVRGRMGPVRQHARGFTVSYVNDIRPIKATKLMYNAAISPLAAAAGIDNGDLLANPLARKLFFALLQENYAILRAAEVPLGKVGPFATTHFRRATPTILPPPPPGSPRQAADHHADHGRNRRTSGNLSSRPIQHVDRGMHPRLDLVARQARRDRLAEAERHHAGVLRPRAWASSRPVSTATGTVGNVSIRYSPANPG